MKGDLRDWRLDARVCALVHGGGARRAGRSGTDNGRCRRRREGGGGGGGGGTAIAALLNTLLAPAFGHREAEHLGRAEDSARRVGTELPEVTRPSAERVAARRAAALQPTVALPRGEGGQAERRSGCHARLVARAGINHARISAQRRGRESQKLHGRKHAAAPPTMALRCDAMGEGSSHEPLERSDARLAGGFQ